MKLDKQSPPRGFARSLNRSVLGLALVLPCLGVAACSGVVDVPAATGDSNPASSSPSFSPAVDAYGATARRWRRGTGGSGGAASATGGTSPSMATGGTVAVPATGGVAPASSTGGAGPSSGTAQQRPSYNKSTGFFVVGSKLYDANGNEFRPRGLNHLHWDNQSVGIPKTGANTERWDLDFNQSMATNLDLMNRSIGNKLVPIPGNWDGTCNQDPAMLTTIVNKWLAHAAEWKTLEKYLLINIANEWGPENSTVWRDSYISAIAALRAAGLNSTIVVDAGGCGQDDKDVILYGADVFNSDPQKNVVFDVHIYGGWAYQPTDWWLRDIDKSFDALAATGLPILIGEFGPGRNIGPSPTLLTPGQVITAAEAHNFGWLVWAWDDPAGEYTSPPRDDWFGMSFTGDYTQTSDLTTFGKDVVENPVYGLKALGKRATIF